MKEERINYVFDLTNGNWKWQSDPQVAIDGLGGATANSSPERAFAYGYLISGSVGGIVYCYNATTGAVHWTYEVTDPHIGESYLTERWWLTLCFISSGKAYFGHHEHSSQVPQPRGAPFFAIDIETGKVVWEIDGAFRQHAWGGRAIIGDSIIATLDTYDLQIYAIGKGPTAITVSTPNTAISLGKSLLITGTIMDISPGTQNDKLQFRFPRGVPAMADECMSDWMLHVYKDFEITTDMDLQGVPIELYALDPNGNDIPIGVTVSDAQGNFVIKYTPEVPGQYDIYAFFYGSKAYYGDYTNTGLLVIDDAPDKPLPYELYIICMGIAIIITVIIACLVILKKNK
jgi:outer membrane protein assembly factor BamB